MVHYVYYGVHVQLYFNVYLVILWCIVIVKCVVWEMVGTPYDMHVLILTEGMDYSDVCCTEWTLGVCEVTLGQRCSSEHEEQRECRVHYVLVTRSPI